MDSANTVNININELPSLLQTMGTPTANDLGFMAGILLVLMLIMLAFGIATFVLGIVATVKATKAGRSCGWETPMAKASLGFGIFGIIAPFLALEIPDSMGATFVLVAGFIMSIIGIASASNRLKAKAIADRAPVAQPIEDNPMPEVTELTNQDAAAHAAQAVASEGVPEDTELADAITEPIEVVATDEQESEVAEASVTEDVESSDDEPNQFEVITANEALVTPVDPTEPAIEDESLSSVDDMQDGNPTEATDSQEFGDDETDESIEDDVDELVKDEPVADAEDEEPVEPMHKMTSDERDAEIAAIKANAAQRAADAAARKARALERAAEDPEYAAYLLEQGKLKGSLKKSDD